MKWKLWEYLKPIYDFYVSKKDIWQYKQNYPDLIVDDLSLIYPQVDRDVVYSVLLQRGINKWLMNRYLLIRYKKLIPKRVNEYVSNMRYYKQIMGQLYSVDIHLFNQYKRKYLITKGKVEALQQVRGELKTICMGPRYVVYRYRKPGYISLTGMTDKRKKEWLDLAEQLFHESDYPMIDKD